MSGRIREIDKKIPVIRTRGRRARRERREPAEGEPRRSDQGVRVEHPQQDEVDEEPLGPALLLGEVTVLR